MPDRIRILEIEEPENRGPFLGEMADAAALWGRVYICCRGFQAMTGSPGFALPVAFGGFCFQGIRSTLKNIRLANDLRHDSNIPVASVGVNAMWPIEDSFAYERVFSNTPGPHLSPTPKAQPPVRLPKTAFRRKCPDSGVDQCGPCCPICLSDWKTDDEVSSGQVCGHTFHHDCIHRWVSRSRHCPCCRQALLKSEDDPNTEYHYDENASVEVSTSPSRLFSPGWLVSCQDLAQHFVISPSGEPLDQDMMGGRPGQNHQ